MGDYVDRGACAPEVVSYLCALKVRYPSQIYLLRGNHETREMTEKFDFREQMVYCYDEDTYQVVMDLFD